MGGYHTFNRSWVDTHSRCCLPLLQPSQQAAGAASKKQRTLDELNWTLDAAAQLEAAAELEAEAGVEGVTGEAGDILDMLG